MRSSAAGNIPGEAAVTPNNNRGEAMRGHWNIRCSGLDRDAYNLRGTHAWLAHNYYNSLLMDR